MSNVVCVEICNIKILSKVIKLAIFRGGGGGGGGVGGGGGGVGGGDGAGTAAATVYPSSVTLSTVEIYAYKYAHTFNSFQGLLLYTNVHRYVYLLYELYSRKPSSKWIKTNHENEE